MATAQPSATGCTRDAWADGLTELTANNPAEAAVTTRLHRPIFVKGQGGILRWSVTVTNTTGNLVRTANQASVETDTAGFYAAGLATLSRSTTYAAHGSASIAATSTGAGTYGINVGTPGDVGTQARVDEGDVYQVTAVVRCTTTRNVTPKIYWRNSGGGAVSTTTGDTVSVPSSGFVEVPMSGTAPAGAAYAILEWLGNAAPGAGEVLYIDKIGMWKGASGGTWALPGSAIQGVTGGASMTAQAQVIFYDDDDAQVDRWTGPQLTIADAAVLLARQPVPRLATTVELKVLSLCDTNAGEWTEEDILLEQVPADDPYVPPAVDPTFGEMSPEGVAPPAPPAGLSGFEANSPARRSPQVRWCQLHDSIRPDLTPKKNAREV